MDVDRADWPRCHDTWGPFQDLTCCLVGVWLRDGSFIQKPAHQIFWRDNGGPRNVVSIDRMDRHLLWKGPAT